MKVVHRVHFHLNCLNKKRIQGFKGTQALKNQEEAMRFPLMNITYQNIYYSEILFQSVTNKLDFSSDQSSQLAVSRFQGSKMLGGHCGV